MAEGETTPAPDVARLMERAQRYAEEFYGGLSTSGAWSKTFPVHRRAELRELLLKFANEALAAVHARETELLDALETNWRLKCEYENRMNVAEAQVTALREENEQLKAALDETPGAHGRLRAEMNLSNHLMRMKQETESALEALRQEHAACQGDEELLNRVQDGDLTIREALQQRETLQQTIRDLQAENADIVQQFEVLKPGGRYAWKSKAEALEQTVRRLTAFAKHNSDCAKVVTRCATCGGGDHAGGRWDHKMVIETRCTCGLEAAIAHGSVPSAAPPGE